MEHKNIISLGWDNIARDCEDLAKTIPEGSFKAILAVAQGGVVPAVLLAKILKIKLFDVIGISSYIGDVRQENMEIIKYPASDFITQCPQGEGVLVIDDLVDTGSTAHILRAYMPKAILGVLYTKPLGKPFADIYLREYAQSDWIVFPWERCEG